MDPIDYRPHLFLDLDLIDEIAGLTQKLHSPEAKEVAVRLDRPYEDTVMYDPVVMLDDGRYRMWYRCNLNEEPYYTGYAESTDGKQWDKPSLGLIEFDGSKDNNIVWPIPGGKGFSISLFKDEHPDCINEERYKGIGVAEKTRLVYGMVSPDGIHWRNLGERPMIVAPEGEMFDSHNIVLWDSARGHYSFYARGWEGGYRRIRRSVSDDFRNWSEFEYIDLGDSPPEEFYKNAATPYYRDPEIIFMFPKRFVPKRKADPNHEFGGLSDIVFMYSRDGIHFDRRFKEAFIRPGRDQKNWHERAIEVGPGLVPTGGGEMSFYMIQNYRTEDVHIRRMAMREDGFVSIHADYDGGEFTTKPLTFDGTSLSLNYSTSAAGSIQVEVQDQNGNTLPGFELSECPEIYGDEIERTVVWNSEKSLGELEGHPVRFCFVMKDADLYSIHFGYDTL